MNPDPSQQMAYQVMQSRLQGQPMPALSQMSSGAGAPVAPQVPTPQMPQPDKTMSNPGKKSNPHEGMIKSLLPAAASPNPEINLLSKALLSKLINYL